MNFQVNRNIIIIPLLLTLFWGCEHNLKNVEGFYTMEGNTKTFISNGNEIKYFELGEGDPIIFLHGFGASSYAWRYISKHFVSRYKIILIDLKGFGLSDKPVDYQYSINDQSSIILDFIRNHGIKNTILTGHSFGGAVALVTYIKLYEVGNDSIKKLILIDSAGYEQKVPNFIKILQIPIINDLSFLMLPSRFSTKIVLKKVFFDDSKITDEMVETYTRYRKLPGARHALIETAKQIPPKNSHEITEKFKEIQIPVLVIWGKEDEIVPLSIGKRLESDIPNSKLIIIPQSGHAPHEEKPVETIKIISDFLTTQY